MKTKPLTKTRRAALARGVALAKQVKRDEEKLFKSLGPAGTKKLLAQRKREFQEAEKLQRERDQSILDRMVKNSELAERRQNLPPTADLVKLVWELASIADYKTNSLNPNSMSEKDMNSHRAFKLAGQLIGPLLKWAINHEAGKIIANNASLEEWKSYFNEDAKFAADISKRNLSANSHDNELRGSHYAGNDDRVDRELAAIVLYSISSGMGFDSGRRLEESDSLKTRFGHYGLISPTHRQRTSRHLADTSTAGKRAATRRHWHC